MIRTGDRVAVAVSGGPDSLALLHILRELAGDIEASLAVAHLNHRLRGEESDQDEVFVRRLAESLGLEFFVQSVDVRAVAERRAENLEQSARQVRYQWFHRLIVDGLADKVAVGHTRSDQAETVLYRLLRGSGSAGLSGIHPVMDGQVIRPLLGISRQEVIAYLESHSHQWREDSSNSDEAFDRNRLRHSLMPLLTRDWNPSVEQTLARMADWAQAEEQYWAEILPMLSSGVLEESAEGVSMDAAATVRLPLAAQRRVLRRALERVRGDLRGIDFEHVESLRALLAARSGSIHLPGATATKSFGRALLARAEVIGHGGRADFSLALDAPGRFEIPGTSSALILRLLHRDDVKDGYNKNGCRSLDWDKVPKPLRLRSWRTGDRYRPVGRSGPKKLKTLFQENRIESWRRAGWPVVTGTAEMVDRRPGAGSSEKYAETIVWTREFGPAEQFAAQEGAETLLEITETG